MYLKYCLPDSWVGKTPGEGNGYPLQYSGLKNFMDCLVHWVSRSQMRLNDFHVDAVMDFEKKNYRIMQKKQTILRRRDKNTQKNYIKKIFMTQITMMVRSLP